MDNNGTQEIGKKRRLMDLDTGEEFSSREVVKKLGRYGFEITYVSYLCDLFEVLGNQKMKVLQYIIKNKNIDNVLIATVREMARDLGMSSQTVYRTLKILEEKGVIHRKQGVVMISPKVLHKGDKYREKSLLIKFETFNDNEIKRIEGSRTQKLKHPLG